MVVMGNYLLWRGNSLNGTYPVSWLPRYYPLGIFSSGTVSDKRECERLGLQAISAIRVMLAAGKMFRINGGYVEEVLPIEKRPYRPTYKRLAWRYVHGSFWFTLYAHNDRSKLRASVDEFGSKYYDEIEPRHIKEWIRRQRDLGLKENLIRNRFWQMSGVYRYANEQELVNGKRYRRINYNPVAEVVDYLEPGAEREFCLTPVKFERNYAFLKGESEDVALFYLLLWETGRRPLEVAQWRLEWIDWKMQEVRIPAGLTKSGKPKILPLSNRVMGEIKCRNGVGDEGYITANKNGMPWLYRSGTHQNRVNNSTDTWSRKLKEKYGDGAGWFRDNRGGFMSIMIEKNDPFLVGALADMSSLATIKRYDKRTRERMRLALVGRPNQ